VQVARGGYISPALSNSHGEEVDDVPAQLNAGEYVIPKDVVKWKGKEFFQRLIAQARKARGGDGSTSGQRQGYADGGPIGALQTDFQGGPMYSGAAGEALAQRTGLRYRQVTPPRMGWWGHEPGNIHQQTPDIRQYPELYGGTRSGWRPWEHPGDIGYAWGQYTQPLDPETGQPLLITPEEMAGGGPVVGGPSQNGVRRLNLGGSI
jgi:hypothetical protein